MKNAGLIIVSAFLGICLSVNTHAQSSENDLDQVKLMEQLEGTWEAEVEQDTILYWDLKPYAKGYTWKFKWVTGDEAFAKATGVSGFNGNYKKINAFVLWEDGTLARDLGQFVSEKKLVMERFNVNHSHVIAMWELTLVTPDKADMIYKWKGKAEDYDENNVMKWTFVRLKK